MQEQIERHTERHRQYRDRREAGNAQQGPNAEPKLMEQHAGG